MDESDCLERFGLHPSQADLAEIRRLLAEETQAERSHEGEGVAERLKLLCVQLFNAGMVEDSLVIWRAKSASFDAGCSIDVQLLCGAGLAETKHYLSSDSSSDARAALAYLLECEATGDFAAFTPQAWSAHYSRYFRQT